MDKFLPWTRKVINGVNILAQSYKQESFSELLSLLKRSTKDSTGIGEGEFQNAKDLKKYLAQSNLALTYHDAGRNNTLIGCLLIYVTPLSRSTVPLYAAGYSVVDKYYRGMRLYKHLIVDVYEQYLVETGCPGSLARQAITAVTAIAHVKSGGTHAGLIPKSINVPKFGWVPDCIPYSLYDVLIEENFIQVVLSIYLETCGNIIFLGH